MTPGREYRIAFSRRAGRQFDKLPEEARARLAERIDRLATNPRGPGVKALQGKEGGYRVRDGAYRALYDINDETAELLIFEVGHRREVYDR